MNKGIVYIPVINQLDADFAIILAEQLEQEGYNPYLLPEYPERRDIDINSNYMLTEYHSYEPDEPIQYYLSKFNIETPKEIILTEMVYDGKYPMLYSESSFCKNDAAKYMTKLHRMLSYFDKQYSGGKGGTPIQYLGGEIIRLSLRIVSEFYGYDNIWVGFTPVEGSHSVFSDECVNWPSFDLDFDIDMDDEDKSKAEDFLEIYIESKKRITHSNKNEPSIAKSAYQKLKTLLKSKNPLLPVDYLYRKSRRTYKRYSLNQICLNKPQSKEFVENNKIVYFPHQYHIESRITVRGKPFYNYEWIMEYVSRSLPLEHSLVVKPHPTQWESIPTSLMQKLSEYVTFLSPDLNSHDIIQDSSAVVTVNNTVGFEALLHGTSVVCLGNAFYSGCGYTFDVHNINNISDIINDAVSSNDLTDTQRLEVAHRVLTGSYPGRWGNTDSANVEKFQQSIITKLEVLRG